jgi:hypothetical protein
MPICINPIDAAADVVAGVRSRPRRACRDGGCDAWPMPIANCFLAQASEQPDAQAIVAAWSQRSGIDADEMTVKVVDAQQGGKAYAVMAWLYLPSLWPEEDVVALGEGLAAALADVLHVDASAVQVLTSIVNSGLVVDGGETLRW